MLILRGNTLAEIARRNRQEIIKAGLSRRDLFKLGLITSGGYLVAKKGLSARASYADDNETCSSPPTRAFIELLPTPRDGTMPIQTPVTLNPTPLRRQTQRPEKVAPLLTRRSPRSRRRSSMG